MVTIRQERPADVAAREKLLDAAYGPVRFTKTSERLREGRLPDKLTHPWFYDAKERAQQHKEDEAAYPEDSPWRYNDITADNR